MCHIGWNVTHIGKPNGDIKKKQGNVPEQRLFTYILAFAAHKSELLVGRLRNDDSYPHQPAHFNQKHIQLHSFLKMKQILTDDFQVCATHKNRPRPPSPGPHPGSYSSSNLTAELRSSSRPLAELPHHKEDSGFILFSQASCLWT